MNIGTAIGRISAQTPVEHLAGNSALSEPEKVGELSRQFEAMLVRHILSEAQKPVFKSSLTDNSFAGDVYRDMTVQQLAESITQAGGLGLATALQQQLTRRESTE